MRQLEEVAVGAKIAVDAVLHEGQMGNTCTGNAGRSGGNRGAAADLINPLDCHELAAVLDGFRRRP